MKNTKKLISALLLCALLLSTLALGGCMSKRERRIRDDLNADGTLVSAVQASVNSDYIEVTGFTVTEVNKNETVEVNGKTVYSCDVTVSNEYVAVTVPCAVTYSGDDVFEGVTVSGREAWNYKALSGVDQTKVGYEDLPNHESVPYGECTVKKVEFSKRDQTSVVSVDIKADAGYVIASGELQINFAYAGGKWAVDGYSYGKDFSMSWDIGGLWRGDEWKWSKTSTMNLRIEFSIDSISPDGKISSTIHSHIRIGKKDQENLYPATGTLDFATMTLTLDYVNDAGPCRITAKFVKEGDFAARFEGAVVGTEDNFKYYKGRFKRDN